MRRGRRFRRTYEAELSSGVTVLTGANGAGKTSLLLTLATLLPVRSGTVRLLGHTYGPSTNGVVRRALGYCPQMFNARPRERVMDLMRYSAWLRGVSKQSNEERSLAALEQVDLRDRANDRFGDLSGGMQRRIAIAQAIVHQPRLLLLDEPDAGLDQDHLRSLVRLLDGLGGEAIVLVAAHQHLATPKDWGSWNLRDG